MGDLDEKLQEYLDSFDRAKLGTIPERRAAFKHLHDYYYRLIKEAAVRFFYIHENTVKNAAINLCWTILGPSLLTCEEYDEWTGIILKIAKIRNSKTEHVDFDSDPGSDDLKMLREEAPKFRNWLINIGKEYHSNADNFKLKTAYSESLEWFSEKAEILLRTYENRLELPQIEQNKLKEVASTLEQAKKILAKIPSEQDLTKDDLQTLINLIKSVYEFEGRVDTLLSLSICPLCGGKITDKTTYSYSSNDEDAEPIGVRMRVGCERCDYTLADDYSTI